MSMASCTSPRVSDSGLPISRVMSRARSSLRFTSDSAARYKISARRGAGNSRQCLNAAFAASTASFTSSCVEDGKIPTSSPRLAGLRFSNVPPRRASTHSPLIRFLWLLETALVVMMLPPGFDRGVLLKTVGGSRKQRRGGTFPAWQFNVAEGHESVKQAPGWPAANQITNGGAAGNTLSSGNTALINRCPPFPLPDKMKIIDCRSSLSPVYERHPQKRDSPVSLQRNSSVPALVLVPGGGLRNQRPPENLFLHHLERAGVC